MYRERRVIGPPGTGKTTFLTSVLRHQAATHGRGNVVACSLTHAAANELAGRDTSLPPENIGTLHAFAYRALGRPLVVETDKYIAGFNEGVPPPLRLGTNRGKDGFDMSAPGGDGEGARRWASLSVLRAKQVPQELWPPDVVQLSNAWQSFKDDLDGVDYTDMLELALRDVNCHPQAPAVLIADEVQDFSSLSMALLWKWAAACDEIVTAGDPDQAIYEFAGADPEVFRKRPAHQTKILEQSYRVPRAVHEIASHLISRNTDRDTVTYLPRDAAGSLRHSGATINEPRTLLPEIEQAVTEGRRVMLLTSCAYMLRGILDMLRSEGLPYGNAYRPTEAAWNPLARRENTQAATDRVLDYLRPFLPGAEEYWSQGELKAWLELCAKLKARGATLPDDDPSREVELDEFLPLIADPEAADILFHGPPGGLRCLKQHLATKWQRTAGYACDVAIKRGPEALQAEPLITVGTIHSVKGGEADTVYLFPDLSYAAACEYQTAKGRNSTRRLYYVGMTRAKEELVLCQPGTNMAVNYYA